MTDRFLFYILDVKSSPQGCQAASEWLREVGGRHGLSDERLYSLDLCAGEVLANIAEHAYRGTGDVRLELMLDLGAASLTVIDSGPPFNPLTFPAHKNPHRLEDARVGGLGIHLIRRFADSARYEYVDPFNRLVLRFGSYELLKRTRDRRLAPAVSFPFVRPDGTRLEKDPRGGIDRRAAGFISRTPLFQGVPSQIVDNILHHCELRECAGGEVLFRAGERHRCVLLAVEGRLEVHLDGPDSRFFVDLEPGESVGELSVADGKPNSAWVVATTASRLLVIPESVFLNMVLAVPAIVRNLIVTLSERMRRSNIQVVERVRAGLELEALQRELDTARQIQASMLPAARLFPDDAQIKGRGYMRAARQVGGDFYDAFSLGDHRYFVAIGDVCNKGMPAALFMVRTLTVLRGEALNQSDDLREHLARLAERCNDLLASSNEAQQFVTLFCGIIDLEHSVLHFVNAGHLPPLLRSADETTVFLDTPHNPLAGLVPGIKYKVGSCEFPSGSGLLLYTDGITEAEAGNEVFFGDEVLRNMVAATSLSDVDACVEKVVAAVDAFSGGHPQTDDLTLLALYRP